jgi:alpha-D-ribose 1-methylphosphonate 5-triphosphate synthase subunit PhnL
MSPSIRVRGTELLRTSLFRALHLHRAMWSMSPDIPQLYAGGTQQRFQLSRNQ